MKPELLMPAGDLEKAKIAYQFGADACYGSTGAFSMRTREIGFTYKTLEEAVDYAHSINKKFFITCNIYPHEFEINNIKKHIKKLISMKPDALIVADPGVLTIVKNEITKYRKKITNKSQKINNQEYNVVIASKAKQFSNLTMQQLNKIEIHLSTQANTTNSESIKFWHELGVKRFILARELSLKEIAEIKKNIPKSAVLETFVHGAMCNSVSGRCNLSNYLSNRDANRGACVQACRWKFSLIEEKRPNQYIPVEEDENGSYIYNSKDLNMIEHLKELKDAGIESFKVEGRNKSIYYCAIVARVYRKAIDAMNVIPAKAGIQLNRFRVKPGMTIKPFCRELKTVTNRGYSTGFYFGNPGKKDINYKTSRPTSDWHFVGIVKDVIARNAMTKQSDNQIAAPSGLAMTNSYLIECRNEIKKDSWVEIVTPKKIYRKKLTEFVTPTGEKLTKVNPNDQFVLDTKNDIPINSMIRQKIKGIKPQGKPWTPPLKSGR